MKKIYNKPQIIVEAFTMDQPIAANCNMSKADLDGLLQLGCFNPERGCIFHVQPNGGFDTDFDGTVDMEDTVCYHSNVQYAFTS